MYHEYGYRTNYKPPVIVSLHGSVPINSVYLIKNDSSTLEKLPDLLSNPSLLRETLERESRAKPYSQETVIQLTKFDNDVFPSKYRIVTYCKERFWDQGDFKVNEETSYGIDFNEDCSISKTIKPKQP